MLIDLFESESRGRLSHKSGIKEVVFNDKVRIRKIRVRKSNILTEEFN